VLGTGVDFLGIVFTLHVDIPYSMIDFAQESGRVGRTGKDVDSVVLVEEGKAERQLASGKAAIDESIICEFVTTAGCRRRVIGLYLDNKETGYSNEASVANCDRYSEGTTAIERVYTKRAIEYQTVEETLDEVVGSYVFCFVDSIEEAGID
jgi:superfamily II DNA helicase RecQ